MDPINLIFMYVNDIQQQMGSFISSHAIHFAYTRMVRNKYMHLKRDNVKLETEVEIGTEIRKRNFNNITMTS